MGGFIAYCCRHAGNKSSSTNRDYQIAHIRKLFQYLQGNRTLTRHDQVIIEMVDEKCPGSSLLGQGSRAGLVKVTADQHHLGPIVAGCLYLLRRVSRQNGRSG